MSNGDSSRFRTESGIPISSIADDERRQQLQEQAGIDQEQDTDDGGTGPAPSGGASFEPGTPGGVSRDPTAEPDTPEPSGGVSRIPDDDPEPSGGASFEPDPQMREPDGAMTPGPSTPEGGVSQEPQTTTTQVSRFQRPSERDIPASFAPRDDDIPASFEPGTRPPTPQEQAQQDQISAARQVGRGVGQIGEGTTELVFSPFIPGEQSGTGAGLQVVGAENIRRGVERALDSPTIEAIEEQSPAQEELREQLVEPAIAGAASESVLIPGQLAGFLGAVGEEITGQREDQPRLTELGATGLISTGRTLSQPREGTQEALEEVGSLLATGRITPRIDPSIDLSGLTTEEVIARSGVEQPTVRDTGIRENLELQETPEGGFETAVRQEQVPITEGGVVEQTVIERGPISRALGEQFTEIEAAGGGGASIAEGGPDSPPAGTVVIEQRGVERVTPSSLVSGLREQAATTRKGELGPRQQTQQVSRPEPVSQPEPPASFEPRTRVEDTGISAGEEAFIGPERTVETDVSVDGGFGVRIQEEQDVSDALDLGEGVVPGEDVGTEQPPVEVTGIREDVGEESGVGEVPRIGVEPRIEQDLRRPRISDVAQARPVSEPLGRTTIERETEDLTNELVGNTDEQDGSGEFRPSLIGATLGIEEDAPEEAPTGLGIRGLLTGQDDNDGEDDEDDLLGDLI